MKDIVNTTVENLKVVDRQIADMQKAAADMRKAAVEPLLEALAASGEVSVIYVYGYTPGFNDGEPCEHTFSYYVNISELLGEERLSDVIDEEWIEELHDGYRMTTEQTAENIELCRANGHIYNPPSREIVSIIGSILVDTIEAEKGTDYFVSFVLKDGQFERTDGHYDCGY